jgi:hypothetical protein
MSLPATLVCRTVPRPTVIGTRINNSDTAACFLARLAFAVLIPKHQCRNLSYDDRIRRRDFFQARLSSSTAGPSFTYRVASAYSAKRQRFNPERDMFKWNPYNRFQPSTSEKVPFGKRVRSRRPESGQDAFFVSRVGNTGDLAFGVVRNLSFLHLTDKS